MTQVPDLLQQDQGLCLFSGLLQPLGGPKTTSSVSLSVPALI